MLKRAFDIVFSACWLIGFAPLLLVVAILVRLKLGSPIFFIQERPACAPGRSAWSSSVP